MTTCDSNLLSFLFHRWGAWGSEKWLWGKTDLRSSDFYLLSQIPQQLNNYDVLVPFTVLRHNLEDSWSVSFDSRPKVGKLLTLFYLQKLAMRWKDTTVLKANSLPTIYLFCLKDCQALWYLRAGSIPRMLPNQLFTPLYWPLLTCPSIDIFLMVKLCS